MTTIMSAKKIKVSCKRAGTSIYTVAFTSTTTRNDVVKMRNHYQSQSKIATKLHHQIFSSSSPPLSNSNTNTNTNANANANTNSYFHHHLKSPKHVMAPMVAQSDLPFRILCRLYDTDLCYTQMIHSTNFVKSTLFQNNHLDVYPNNNGNHNDKSSKLYMSESGWNILHDLKWKTFEQQCTFLQQTNDYDHLNNIDQDEIYNLIQLCKQDHDNFLNDCNHDIMNVYGLYYEGLPKICNTIDSITATTSNSDKNPLIVQIAGYDPKTMTQAAQSILSLTNNNEDINNYNGQVKGIDINCGCPQAIARKGNYGAFLMENEFQSVCNIIQSLRDNLPSQVGISIKMRIPPEYSNGNSKVGYNILKARINAMIDSGVDLITVHGRTLHENKTKVRHCNWDSIHDAKSIIQKYHHEKGIPIIANGGIETYQNVVDCLKYTKANAVMSSESLLENPGLFNYNMIHHSQEQEQQQQQSQLSPREIFQQQIRYCHEYLDLCILFPPLPGSLGKMGGSFNVIRSHLFKILYRYLEEHSDLRTLLAEPKKMTTIQSARDLVNELERRYFDVMDAEYNKLGRNTERNRLWIDLNSSNPNSSWYRRHRDAIASNKMKIRGAKDDDRIASLSIEDKKNAMRERIAKLKQQKEMQQQQQQQSTDESIAV